MAWLLYTRRGCHLCEEAEDLLAVWRVKVELVDVDSDAAALAAYGARVPVLVRDGTVALEGRFDERAVATLVRDRD
ncbi:MAG: glutaredoxin family protein [Planctomycetota bacterium]